MLPITYLGPLTEEDRKTLEQNKGAHLFFLVLKLLSSEYAKTAAAMANANPMNGESVLLQGHMRGVTALYNQLHGLAGIQIHHPDGFSQQNPEAPLRETSTLRNLRPGEAEKAKELAEKRGGLQGEGKPT